MGGVNDDRDVRANREGQRFGLRLLSDPGAFPSSFLSAETPGAGGAQADSLKSQLEGK